MFKTILAVAGPALAGVLGWLMKGVQTEGSADLLQTALIALFGSGSAITVWVLVIQAGWKKGGGKLDGKLDAGEIDGILTELLHKAGITSLDSFVDQLAPNLAAQLQSLLAKLPTPFKLAESSGLSGATATQLVDAIKSWDVDDAEDPTDSALYATMLDLLSEAVKNDELGSKAAADIRASLHRLKFSNGKKPAAVAVA